MPPNRIIIDTDPGVDDVLAMLLAFSAKPEELEVLMLSVQFGNIDVQNCLRNVVSLFHFIEKERAWRKEQGRPEGFATLGARKPIVAVGAEEPLAEQMLVADFFHGIDGLGGIHHSHPHLTPAETWKSLFSPAPEGLTAAETAELQAIEDQHSFFTPSLKSAHEEILQLLRDNEPDTITIVAIGPLTNLAIAAATDPEAFLRVKEVVVMGGAVDVPGNMTPGAEFNFYGDSVAAARVLALTSPNPSTTLPPLLHGKKNLPAYPKKLSKQLTLKLFPLDITTPHKLPRTLLESHTDPLTDSPLATWTTIFLTSTFHKILSIAPDQDPEQVGLELHDPLTIWYALTVNANNNNNNGERQGVEQDEAQWEFVEEDIRVETAGQWTRGCCIADRRGKGMRDGDGYDRDADVETEVVGDAGGWLDRRRGNRVLRCVRTPGVDKFAPVLLERMFGDVV